MTTDTEQIRRKRFVRGMLLAWIPILIIVMAPILVGVISHLPLANQKAVGLGAAAGGFSEAFVTFGVIAFFAAEILAVVLLSRSLSKGRPARSFLATISICIDVLIVLVLGGSLWFIIHVGRP